MGFPRIIRGRGVGFLGGKRKAGCGADLGMEWAQLWFYKSKEPGKSGGPIQGPEGSVMG